MHPLRIEYRAPDQLKPYPRNARTHSKKQIRQIAESIRQFGFTNPIIIDGEDAILAGHGRAEAARLVGLKSVPCVRLDQMSPEQKRAYILADNKLAQNAGWDEEILATELQFLLKAEIDFEIGVIGFETHEIDRLIEGLNTEEPGHLADDALPDMPEQGAIVAREGDLWLLGEHRLLCADATSEEAFQRLMAGERAQMVFTDPPYNVPIHGHVGGLGQTRHSEFVMGTGEMTSGEFAGFLESTFRHLVKHTTDGSIHFVCMDWRHISEVLKAGKSTYSELKNLCIWVKDNGGMGTFYRSRHELVFAFKSGNAPHLNSFELGQHGRYRTNVWQYRGVNTFKAGRMDELALHPTVKPVAMIADAIKDVSERGGIVLDCFGGSGSTLIASHKTGRRARVIELDPVYVDRIIRRWQTFAKDDAIHADSGRSFDSVLKERMP